MSFFYDLNKKLNSLRADEQQITESKVNPAPKSKTVITLETALRQDLTTLMEDGTGGANFSGSGSLEEKAGYSAKQAAAGKDIGKPGKNFAKIEKSAGKKYGSKEAGARVAGAVLNKLRAAKESVEEASEELDQQKSPQPNKGIPGNIPVKGKMDRLKGKRDYYETEHEDPSDEDIIDYLNRKLAPHDAEQQPKEDAISKPYNGTKPAHAGIEFEGNAFTGKLKSTPKGGTFDLDGKEYTDTSGLDEAVSRKHFQQMADLLKNIEDPVKRKELAQHHASLFKLANPRFDHNKFMTAADCMDEGVVGATLGGIAGAAVGGPVGAVRGAMAGNTIGNAISPDAEVDEGFADMDAWLKDREKAKGTGKFDSRKVSTGTVYTRRPETFDEPEGDDEVSSEPKRRGRPAIKNRAPERVTSKAWKHKGGRVEEASETCPHCGGPMKHKKDEIVDEKVEAGKRHFFDKLAPAAKKVAKVVKAVTNTGKEEVEEKAVSKKQQKFMGMVHAAQKGEKPASKEVAKVAKTMKKSDANDFASTKQKGLPEKAKAKKTENAKPDFLDVDKDGDKKETFKKAVADKKEEKVDETTTSGSVATSTSKAAKGGMKYGGGIYDSWNRDLESMIVESVEVKTQVAEHITDGNEETITITATGDDVHRFKELLAQMGIGQGGDGEVGHEHGEEPCGSCGGVPCQCDELGHTQEEMPAELDFEIDEAEVTVSQNEPDYPTDQEYSDDALQYSGGLDGKKSTGQTTIPVIASQAARQMHEERSLFDLYKAIEVRTK